MTINEWAEDFKSYINELQIPRDDYKGIMSYIDDTLALLKEQESIIKTLKSDLQETLDIVANRGNVVRCKDCKHWEQLNGHCPFNSIFTNADWFCADGERKEEE